MLHFPRCSEHSEGCGLGAARGLAYIAQVVDMEVDEFAEGFRQAIQSHCDRLGVGAPAPRIVALQEGLADAACAVGSKVLMLNRS
ncbi:hypothetical protein X769_22015 [Mesorhizobium sp. LSJC268A00]|nr:hypothetical protein X769_22015 [Mesorhizobium sp. LSJC268A00]ESZ17781.1 hypothetical protein X735_11940 [Mesorhizobium sp. L2C085B000]ESZ37833.1 hypothetical protein X731_29520 [Mesorhizobium sp. L2C054A000]